MEFQRQQLTFAIAQIREKKSTGIPIGQDERAVAKTQKPAVKEGPSNERKQLPITAAKRPRAEKRTDDELAQQIADWPNHQPADDQIAPDMQFDTDVIQRFLQNAARFVLRRDTNATVASVNELMASQVTFLYGRSNDPPSNAELAVATVQHWQMVRETNDMIENVSGWIYGRDDVENPYGFQIHHPRNAIEQPRASLVEIQNTPAEPPKPEWLVRMSYPANAKLSIRDVDGEIGAITEDFTGLANGISVRRDGVMLEFLGPPTADVSFALGFFAITVRLRMCSTYIVVNERFRLDQNGVSNILENTEELRAKPTYAIYFFDAEFSNVRIRFGDSRARIELVGGEVQMKDLGRVNWKLWNDQYD